MRQEVRALYGVLAENDRTIVGCAESDSISVIQSIADKYECAISKDPVHRGVITRMLSGFAFDFVQYNSKSVAMIDKESGEVAAVICPMKTKTKFSFNLEPNEEGNLIVPAGYNVSDGRIMVEVDKKFINERFSQFESTFLK